MTPAAGPDSTMNTGRSPALSKVSTPPPLCITSSSASTPRPRSRSSIEPRYSWTIGWIPALMTTVLARSYSRNSGTMLDDSETATSGQLLGEDRADPLLVDRVGVGVQQADRDRLDALLGERPGDRPDRVLVERDEHLAVPVEPFRDPEAQRPRDERDGLLELDVVQRRPDLAADLEDVAEALGRDQRGPRDLALDDRVGRHGRAVDDVAQAGRVRLGRREDPVGGVEEALARVARRRARPC